MSLFIMSNQNKLSAIPLLQNRPPLVCQSFQRLNFWNLDYAVKKNVLFINCKCGKNCPHLVLFYVVIYNVKPHLPH